MQDGVPRGGYKGVVTIRWEKARLLLAPSPNFHAVVIENNATLVKVDATGAIVRGKRRTIDSQTS